MQHPIAMAAGTTDAVSDAVVRPEASLFIRQILEKALSNPVRMAPRWEAQAWAALANVLLNDFLNWWNDAGPEVLRAAEDAAENALALDPQLAFAHHAKGLVHRARGQHKAALRAFRTAKQLDPGFARAHAQFGNQKAALMRESEVHDPLDKAISLNPRHPAIGYFYWAKGRAFFQQKDWWNAIDFLSKSVEALPTVWYNRVYLAAAQNSVSDAAQKAAARQTMNAVIELFGRRTLARIAAALQPNPNDPASVAEMRKSIHDFIIQF